MKSEDPQKKQINNPMHGVKLADILEHLVTQYGWNGLSARIPVRCFSNNPSIKSSLNFLRKTPWARNKVEALYLESLKKVTRYEDRFLKDT